jgi:hypothetical protein
MKIAEKFNFTRLLGRCIFFAFLISCTRPGGHDPCVFTESPDQGLFRDNLQQLEIVDAETGEVATYNTQGNPVLEGGQPLALWVELETPTRVEICVIQADGHDRVSYRSQVTFSNEITTQPLGRYDIGIYRIYISTEDGLVTALEFEVR